MAGVGAPLLAIVVWALFVSPRAVFAVHPFVRAFVELLGAHHVQEHRPVAFADLVAEFRRVETLERLG